MTQARPSAPTSAEGPSRGIVRRFWRDFLRQSRGAIIGVALLMISAVLLQLPAPVLTMYIVDHALASAMADDITQLALLFAGMILLRSLFSYMGETATLKLKERIILDLEMRLIPLLARGWVPERIVATAGTGAWRDWALAVSAGRCCSLGSPRMAACAGVAR